MQKENFMKYEWRKEEKEIYPTKTKPQLCKIPQQQFLTIKGQGNPNDQEFSEKVGALYALSYTLKMMPRKGVEIDGYYDYTVYPLEGFWTMPADFEGGEIDKDLLIYEIMIKQPSFVTEELVEEAKKMAAKKADASLLDSIVLKNTEEGLVVQALHRGSFDEEYQTFEKINEYCVMNQLARTGKEHKEIYLSDFSKVTPDKLKTILRVTVREE